MYNQIEVGMVLNEVKEKIRFEITLPYSFIQNENFMEVMQTYKLTDTARWLEALADFIRLNTEGGR